MKLASCDLADSGALLQQNSALMSLSPLIRFGTSTWTYEGWQGQVYLKPYAKSAFARECLGEYCQYLYDGEPLFRTVGNDSTFYRPPTANQLRRYLTQIVEDFDMCFKVWESITIPTFAKQARYGVKAGQPNPQFPDAKLFNHLVLTPYRDAKFERHTGPFLFEFQRHGQSIDEFCSRLHTFFCQLPKDFRYAVEIRNVGLLGYVLVNNRSEGNAPLTIQALMKALQG